jgi:hypothetical protein
VFECSLSSSHKTARKECCKFTLCFNFLVPFILLSPVRIHPQQILFIQYAYWDKSPFAPLQFATSGSSTPTLKTFHLDILLAIKFSPPQRARYLKQWLTALPGWNVEDSKKKEQGLKCKSWRRRWKNIDVSGAHFSLFLSVFLYLT